MKCPKCGQEVQGKFCSFCGTLLPQEGSPEYRPEVPLQGEVKKEPPSFIPERGQPPIQPFAGTQTQPGNGQWNENGGVPPVQRQAGDPSPLWQPDQLPKEKKKTAFIVIIIIAATLVVVLGIILMVILSQNMRKLLENPDIAANSQVSSSQSTSEDNPVLSGQIQVVNGTFSITAQELVDGINHMVSLEYPLIGELQKEEGQGEIRYTNTISQELQIIISCDPQTGNVRSVGFQDSQYTEENYSWIYYAYLMQMLDFTIDDQIYEELTDDLVYGAGGTYEVYYQQRGQIAYGCYYDDDILYLSITPADGIPVEPAFY